MEDKEEKIADSKKNKRSSIEQITARWNIEQFVSCFPSLIKRKFQPKMMCPWPLAKKNSNSYLTKDYFKIQEKS